MNPWHVRNPEEYERQKAEVKGAHPYLHFSTGDGQVRVAGSLEIRDAGKVLDRYLIRIDLPASYPASIPEVFEVGGRIPRVVDRHCFEESGAACVLLPDERWKVWPDGSSLLSFIDGPVRHYFINQAVFERDGVWPLGEWEHGLYGRAQYYRETFGTDDPVTVGRYLGLLLGEVVKGHWDCPCGSGKRVRNCHMALVVDLRSKIPKSEVQKTIARLESDVKSGFYERTVR